MATYTQVKYCPKCKKTVTASKDEKCKVCGNKVSRGKWTVQFWIDDFYGKKQKKLSGFATKREAQQGYVDFMSTYVPLQRDTRKTFIFEDVYKEYIQYCLTENSDATVYEKKHNFELYILPTFREKNIQTITKAELLSWQTALWNAKGVKGKPLAWATLVKIKTTLSNFLGYCENLYDIPNQMRTIKTPKKRELKTEINFWELKTFNKFISTVEDVVHKTIYEVFFYTGIRYNELRALSDNDIIGNTIYVTKSLNGKKSRFDKNGTKPTKNYQNITKKIPTILADDVKKYKSWKKENGMSEKFLFGGDEPLSENQIRRFLIADIEKAGVEYISPHGFRHSYVSMLIEAGISTKVIAELIGDREEQVIRTYGHLYAGAKDTAIDILEKHISSTK